MMLSSSGEQFNMNHNNIMNQDQDNHHIHHYENNNKENRKYLRPMPCCYREQWIYQLYNKFRIPVLYQYATLGHWDLIPDRCIHFPKEVMYQYKYPPHDTALHKIIRLSDGELQIRQEITNDETVRKLDEIKVHAIRAILQATTTAVATATTTSSSTTTCATPSTTTPATNTTGTGQSCDGNKDKNHIPTSYYSPVLSIQDSYGKTPLHLICSDICRINNNNNQEQTVDDQHQQQQQNNTSAAAGVLILQSYPQAAGYVDYIYKRTPLHWFCLHNVYLPPSFLHLLITSYPRALLMQDTMNDTPYDIMIKRQTDIQNYYEVIEMITKYTNDVKNNVNNETIKTKQQQPTTGILEEFKSS